MALGGSGYYVHSHGDYYWHSADGRRYAIDLNPRVLGPKVHGFAMPRSWFIDLTSTWVG